MQSSTAIGFVILLEAFNFVTAQEGRIYDGKPVTIADAPYMAQIKYQDDRNHYCGGGILRDDLILTAGHCVRNSRTLEDHDAEGFTVLVGATKHKDYKSGQKMYVQNVYPHPKFKGQQGQLNHDIGILRLASKIVMGSNIQLIKLALPNEETPEGRKVKVSGWGENPQNPNDRRLYQAKMAISSYLECAKRYHQELPEFKKHKICATAVHGKTCPGDSGCPLIDTKTNRVVGLDSYSSGGCEVLHPIVFTKIIDNLDFINYVMNESGSDESNDSNQSEDSNEPIMEH